MLFRVRLVSPESLRTGKDAPPASLIDLAIAVQTEQLLTSLLCDDRYRPIGEA